MPDPSSHPKPVSGDAPLPTVLLVDDVPAIRRLLEHEFEGFLRVVGEAGDGLEAAKLAAKLRPDLVLLDLNMPDHDGLEAIRAIRLMSPASRIVVLSGLDPSRVGGEAIERGADDFIEKSTPLQEVRQRLTAVLAQRAEDPEHSV